MDSRNRYSSQSRDPFAGSVLFGSPTPQASQAVSPALHQTSTKPIQAMDGFSTARSPYQGRRFGTQDSAQKSAHGLRSETKRPPLSSILDDKMSILAGADGADEFFPNQNRTPGSITLDDERDPFAGDTGSGKSFNSASKFPLHSSSSVRNDLGGRNVTLSNPFASPVAARPPLRSTHDMFSGGRSAIDRLDQYSAEPDSRSTADKSALSPILTLGPYNPAMDRIDAAWSCWVVVSGFYPSAAGRDAVLQLFSQFGDIVDHVLTSGNYLYIKYNSPVHAERAASQHGSFLNQDTLLSVLVLNPRLAQHMGLALNRDGSMQVSNALSGAKKTPDLQDVLGLGLDDTSSGSGSGLGAGLRQRATLGQGMVRDGAQGTDELRGLLGNTEEREAAARRARAETPELYLQPSRRKNICERVVEYFFAY